MLQPGSALVCAGYAMYGSSTELVITFGEGVRSFVPVLRRYVGAWERASWMTCEWKLCVYNIYIYPISDVSLVRAPPSMCLFVFQNHRCIGRHSPPCQVTMFSLDPAIGEFIQTRSNVRIPDKPQRVSKLFISCPMISVQRKAAARQ